MPVSSQEMLELVAIKKTPACKVVWMVCKAPTVCQNLFEKRLFEEAPGQLGEVGAEP